MPDVASIEGIAFELSQHLQQHGSPQVDQLVIHAEDQVLGPVRLNDYWNFISKLYRHNEHRPDRHPRAFYADKLRPILGLTATEANHAFYIFWPEDLDPRKAFGARFLRAIDGLAYVPTDPVIRCRDSSGDSLVNTDHELFQRAAGAVLR